MLSLKQNVIEEKISIIRDDKVLNLITRLVVQKSENTIIGYVITFDDVTNLIAAQKMAAWSDVARRIAHEIKNPLTPIRLSSERLIKKNEVLSLLIKTKTSVNINIIIIIN